MMVATDVIVAGLSRSELPATLALPAEFVEFGAV
jgi:hypothetical protein